EAANRLVREKGILRPHSIRKPGCVHSAPTGLRAGGGPLKQPHVLPEHARHHMDLKEIRHGTHERHEKRGSAATMGLASSWQMTGTSISSITSRAVKLVSTIFVKD